MMGADVLRHLACKLEIGSLFHSATESANGFAEHLGGQGGDQTGIDAA